MKKILLKIKNLKVSAEKKEILKGINFELKEGEIQTILGPNASGKSVSGDQRIVVFDSLNKKVWYPKISTFVNAFVKYPKLPSGNSIQVKISSKRYFTFALNPSTYKVQLYPITGVIKHEAPNELLKITTRSGRNIIVTKNHSLYVLQGTNITPIEAEFLRKGDYILVAKKLNFDLKPPKEIDLLAYFKNNQKIFIKISEVLSKKIVKKFPYLKRSWWYYSGHRKIQISLFLNLIKKIKVNSRIDQQVRIGFKQGQLIPPKIPLNSELARLLGYFIAEGNYSNCIITNSEREIQNDIRLCLKKIFKINKVKAVKKRQVLRIPKIIIHIFHKIFNLPFPCNARTKFIPEIILSSEKLLSNFLRAYFSGDGAIDIKKRCVSCTTKSKRLGECLLLGLTKLGIFSTIHTKKNKKYGNYYRITIYGAYLKTFQDKVGFIQQSRNKKLNEIIKKGVKTHNIDVIPLNKGLFKILSLLNISQKSKLGKTLQTFSAGNHAFSKSHILRIIHQMKGEIKKLEQVRANEIVHLKSAQSLEEKRNLIKRIKAIWKFKWSNISKLSGLNYQGWIRGTLSGRIKSPSEKKMTRLIDAIAGYSNFIEKRILLAKEAIKKINQIVNSDLFFDQITSIQKVKSKGYVYDLEIKPDNQNIENFITFPGGFVAHNSTLAQAILGNPKYKIIKGEILFKGKEITKFPPEKRVKMGIALAWQIPPSIKGVKFSQLLERISREKVEIEDGKNLFEREINVDFSGGEKKISELIQVLALKPKLAIFDEIDSGLDIKRVEKVAKIIKEKLVKKGVSVLIITHSGEILNYLKPNLVSVMLDGKIVCQSRDFEKVLKTIKKYGYEKCKECLKKI
jgi:Fe-S cluster assembly ATP-binding protein